MKTTTEHLNLIDAFHQLGAIGPRRASSGRRTKRYGERSSGSRPADRGHVDARPISKNIDPIIALIRDRVRATDGRISAKRMLPSARAAGYQGSARNFRRAVAKVKARRRSFPAADNGSSASEVG